MKLLFASDNYYLPQLSGGTEVSINTLCRYLKGRGVDVAVSAALGKKGAAYLKNRIGTKLLKNHFMLDKVSNCPVYRDWSFLEAAQQAISDFSPSVVMLMKNSQPLLEILCHQGIPNVVYLQDVYFKDFDFDGLNLSQTCFVSNSEFTRKQFTNQYGLDSFVLPPIVESQSYRVTGNGNSVLFVNPHPMKGVEIACHLFERNPGIEFLMVDSWPLTEDARADLVKRLKPLTNVRWLKCQKDMRKVYRQVRMVIVPSQCDES